MEIYATYLFWVELCCFPVQCLEECRHGLVSGFSNSKSNLKWTKTGGLSNEANIYLRQGCFVTIKLYRKYYPYKPALFKSIPEHTYERWQRLTVTDHPYRGNILNKWSNRALGELSLEYSRESCSARDVRVSFSSGSVNHRRCAWEAGKNSKAGTF